MTRAFISHTFDEGDVRLAETLRAELANVGIDGYMAEKSQKYDLRIHDKIQRAIDESSWLVAVVTAGAQRSASVHEEIGYAIGKNVKVAIMLEKGVEEAGVLVYGKEPEVFTLPLFRNHARKVAEYIRDDPSPAPAGPFRLSEAAEQLLADRSVLSVKSDDFALTSHYGQLYAGAFDGPYKPAILFTACPHEPGNADMAATDRFAEWTSEMRHFEVEGHRIPVRWVDRKVDIGSLTLFGWHPDETQGKRILEYRELHDTGLFEYGTSWCGLALNHRDHPSLHLCRLTGEFWGFLLYAREFYREIGMDEQSFTAFLSIRNASPLSLDNYGDEVFDPVRDAARRLSAEPRTGRQNIQIPRDFGPAGGMTDKTIARAARDAACKICNAYGGTTAKCYDESGRFAWRLWEKVVN